MQDVDRLADSKKKSEHLLVRLLIGGRVGEALMASRNVDQQSRRYLEAVQGLVDASRVRELQDPIRDHVAESVLLQEGAMQAAGRLMRSLPEGSRERSRLAGILSAMHVCAHRNDLVRRHLAVNLGRSLGAEREPGGRQEG